MSHFLEHSKQREEHVQRPRVQKDCPMIEELKCGHEDLRILSQKRWVCSKVGEEKKAHSGRILKDQMRNLDFISTLDNI